MASAVRHLARRAEGSFADPACALPCYNGLTSAYQIVGSLDATNPVDFDDFWQIAANPAPYPVWELTPKLANTNLFTPVETVKAAARSLPAYAAPRIVKIVPELPVTAGGKKRRA